MRLLSLMSERGFIDDRGRQRFHVGMPCEQSLADFRVGFGIL